MQFPPLAIFVLSCANLPASVLWVVIRSQFREVIMSTPRFAESTRQFCFQNCEQVEFYFGLFTPHRCHARFHASRRIHSEFLQRSRLSYLTYIRRLGDGRPYSTTTCPLLNGPSLFGLGCRTRAAIASHIGTAYVLLYYPLVKNYMPSS